MGVTDGTQNKARQRANTKSKSNYHADSSRKTRQDGSGNGNQQVNADHQNCIRRDSSGIKLVSGGIIDQLIKTVQDQLEDAKACVDWYQRKTEDYQSQLMEGLSFRAWD